LFLFPSTFDTNGLVVREAAACGLASVLIRDSCAAEGITDGRNGFIIEENAASMAALLAKVGRDLPYLHEVGSHAMEEIYLSWQSCVAKAYDRYQFILEEKKAGRLQKRKLPTDILVEMTAKGMENSEKVHRYLDEEKMRRQLQEEKIRKLGEDLFSSFKDSAVGMMENMQDAQDSVEQLMGSVREQVKETMKEQMMKMKDMRPHWKE
ncbi:MAG: glycosyltransferase, partial [Blautia sp.]|nr:glycosyltransferase [Blautia sp.]